MNKLMRRIEKLETETTCKQSSLDNLRREKVELENTLEQEQEALVNKLWKRMDQLETEKKVLSVSKDSKHFELLEIGFLLDPFLLKRGKKLRLSRSLSSCLDVLYVFLYYYLFPQIF